MKWRRWTALSMMLLVLSTPAFAVQPDEILNDALLESRARVLSAELRCLVCQNQSIDDSEAPLARDLRILIRERLMAGDSDAGARDFVVARYGDYVLLKPRLTSKTAVLWTAPFLIILAAVAMLFLWRRKRDRSLESPLTSEERAAFDAITKSPQV